VILLGLAALLNDAASEMIYPLLPVFLTATLGATPVVVGLIEGAADALSSILKFAAGSWSDKTPRRRPFVVAGYGLAAASRAMIGVATSWFTVLSARLVDRTGKGIRSAPRDAMIGDVTDPADRGRAFGFHRALDHTGAVAGPLLAVLLLQVLGVPLRQVFLFAVIPGAIGTLLLFFALRETGVHHRGTESTEGLGVPVGETLPRRFRRYMVAVGLFSVANSTDAFLLLQAHAAGVTTAMLPLLWAANHIVKSLFSTQAGALSDRIGRRRMIAAGWIAYAAIYALFPAARSLPAFVALFIAYAIPFTLSEGAERALVGDLVPASSKGRGFGIYYLVSGFGVLAGSALFGVIYQTLSPTAAFATAAALSLAAALAVARGR
jgi:MFS family permease